MNSYLDKNIIKGVFLLILAVSGNFVAETLGCKTQKLLSENMYVKHAVIFMIIYFSINLTANTDIHPNITLIKTLSVWFLFLLFTRMSLDFTLIAFSLIISVYILDTYIDYYNKQKENVDMLTSIQKYIYYLLISVIIIGFILYFNKQYNEHSKNWDTATFIFGKTLCDSRK